jgi:ATP-dependent RNA helicase SUPV3L1/SUV3
MPISFSSPASRDGRARGAGVTAILGPTNTGKTHLAIERMMAHSSGIIGLPLRLLAREVYNKIVDRLGDASVALITGEEKIKPPNARFWISTVEAMPRDLDTAFVAIDEIQLGSDLDRGHVFTDRMLNRRGREETLVLGAATMRPMIEKLLPGAHILTRPRLSQLTFAGDRKLTRLPRRSAVVAFSAEEVYAIAELIRRQRGGAAVVLGSLSPRTRNAQVELFQSGDVEYLVATDAIGMGLNLDVDHVAFASDRKFDGYQFRQLNPAELAQIAGRAGRATRDGTFGTTGRCPPFDDEIVQRLESHSFEPIKVLQWRNTNVDFSSLGALQASLAMVPAEEGLTRAPVAEDILVLEHAARDDAIRGLANTPKAVERLWEACQVPDYRKIAPANHAELVTTLFGFLMREGKIPADWFDRQVSQADRTDGDIDTLSTRIAHVRTWTFVANRPDWLADPEHWQGVARAVEDKLSDALHQRLTERFVDRRTSVLMRRLRENTVLESEIGKTGEVTVEGHVLGRLEGFQFAADPSAGGPEAKALQAAAQKALAGEIDARANKLSQAADDKIVLTADGTLRWVGDAVGKLVAGEEILRPRVRILADEQLTGASRDMVQARLDLWIKVYVEKLLGSLLALLTAEDITGIARGVAFQLAEALGVLERQKVADEVKSLDQPSRATLRKYGVRFGAYHLYMPLLLKPAPRSLATQLWALKHGDTAGITDVQHLASSGRTSIPVDNEIAKPLYRTAGYRVCGDRAVRVDILERLADLIRPALSWRGGPPEQKPAGVVEGGGFTVTVAMTSLTGASGEGFASILRSLGYRMDRKPKPVEQPVAPVVAALSAEASGDATPAEAAPVADRPPPPIGDAAPSVEPTQSPEVAEPAPAERSDAEAGITLSEAPTTAPDASADAPPAPALEASAEAPVETAAAGAAAASAAAGSAASAAPAEEQQFIEVWRPGRSPDERRPPRHARPQRHRRGQQSAAQPPATPAEGAPAIAADASVAADAAATPAKDTPAQHEQRGPRHHHRNKGRRPDQRDRQNRDRNDRGGERPHQARQDDKPKGAPPRERRDKAPDPNSPFAKLAALKAQLEANAKERR